MLILWAFQSYINDAPHQFPAYKNVRQPNFVGRCAITAAVAIAKGEQEERRV